MLCQVEVRKFKPALMTGWQQYSDIIIQFTLYPSSEMAVLRRPVSQRRQARRRDSIKVRGPASKSSKYSTFKRINTSQGTNPQNMVVHRGIGLPDKFRTRLVLEPSDRSHRV